MLNKLKKLKNLKISDVILFALSFLLICNICFCVSMYFDYTNTYYDEDSVAYYLMNENYIRATNVANYFEHIGSSSETMDEYIALTNYYEQAVLYDAYTYVGDDEEAAIYEEKMNDYLEAVGSLSKHIAIINEQLNIE